MEVLLLELKNLVITNFSFSSHDTMLAFENAAFGQPGGPEALCSNMHLTPETWKRLFSRPRLSVAEAVNLCDRPLDPDLRLMVARSERRDRVLSVFAKANSPLGITELEMFANMPNLKTRFGKMLYRQACTLGSPLAREIALRLGGVVQLHWLASDPSLDAESLKVFLESFDSWAPPRSFKAKAQALSQILEAHPDLIEAYAAPKAPYSMRFAAAESRFLLGEDLQRTMLDLENKTSTQLAQEKFLLLVFVNNPVAEESVIDEVFNRISERSSDPALRTVFDSIVARRNKNRSTIREPFSTITDQDALSWLFFRSIPSDFKPEGRLAALTDVALNPNLSPAHRRRAATALASPMALEIVGPRLEKVWEGMLALDPSLSELKPVSFMPPDLADDDEYPSFEEKLDSKRLDDMVKAPVFSLNWLSAEQVSAVAERIGSTIGPNQSAWESFLVLLNNFEGSLEDLASSASLL